MIVVTGFSPTGYRQYGKRFLESFDAYWPNDVHLIAYTEEPVSMPRGECRSLFDIGAAKAFIWKWRSDPVARGEKQNPKWAARHHGSPYNFRFDAVKFCRQCFIPYHAAMGRSGLMCWLDADVVTYKKVPRGFVESLLPKDCDLAYLGRDRVHSEIGFQLYRLPRAMLMLKQFSGYYASERVFDLNEWHSAYVFDRARQETGIRAHNMTPGGYGHVWFQSPLGRYMDHCKGSRKAIGRSLERPC